MVVHELADDDADRIFQALADRTRRDIVARVADAEASVSSLAQRYQMSFAAVQKHVAVLERAGLVSKQRRGREQLVRAELTRIRQAQQLLTSYEQLWQHRVARLDELLTPDSSPSTPHHSDPRRKPCPSSPQSPTPMP